MMEPSPLWPTQQAGVDGFFQAVAAGFRRICLVAATGGGKTRTAIEIAKDYLDRDLRVAWHTNRRLLLDQTSDVFGVHDITAGIRAAGVHPELHHPFQLISTQTDHQRVGKGKKWSRHEAALAIFDEAHTMKGPTIEEMMRQYGESGAVLLGLSATPIGIGHLYDKKVTAGKVSELLKLGKLVRAHHYGPDEPDTRILLKGRKRLPEIGTDDPDGEDFSENEQRKLMGSVDASYNPNNRIVHLHGRIFKEWKRLNPQGDLTLLYAPGVRESVWFTQQFAKAGVRAAHIDGSNIAIGSPGSDTLDWKDSKSIDREEILDGFRRGYFKVLCNRFVLREGIDIPEVRHIILATIYGSTSSYIQTGGRGLRAFPGKEKVIIQDHGGNWHRHGSLNMDREWNLAHSNRMITGLRIDGFRERGEKQPQRCPKCGLILVLKISRDCPCGYEIPPGVKSRPVVTSDGKLVECLGDVYKPHKRQTREDTGYLWSIMYRRGYTGGKKGPMTFRQIEGLFAHEHWYRPHRALPLMPVDPGDWYREICKVPTERLIGPPPEWLQGFRLKMDQKLQSLFS